MISPLEQLSPNSAASSPCAELRRDFLYISYIDDSGSSGANLGDERPLEKSGRIAKSPVQVIGGPIIEEKTYSSIELALSKSVFNLVPEDQWDEFEFHAVDLFHARPPFDRLGLPKCWQLIKEVLFTMKGLKLPVICGVVDRAKLNDEMYWTADPADMAFALYLKLLGAWLDSHSSDPFIPARGLLICDDPRMHKRDDSRRDDPDRRGDVRHSIERAYKRKRNKPIRVSWDDQESVNAALSGMAIYLFDDMYFGNSKNSVGLQLADICVYVVARRLAERPDPEGFYDIIKDQLIYKIFPSAEPSITNDLPKGTV
jgi:hypothetical protein